MSRSTTLARLAAVAATVALSTTGVVTGAAHARDSLVPGVDVPLGDIAAYPYSNSSIGSPTTGNDPSLTRVVSRTHGNVSIVHEVVGDNIGSPGTPVTYRTTLSATDGPARQVTHIASDTTGLLATPGNTTTAPRGAKVIYTRPDGTRVTESLVPTADALGRWAVDGVSWPVDPATGTTVVFEITYEWNSTPLVSPSTGMVPADDKLYMEISGLEPLTWSFTGLRVVCADGCNSAAALPGS